MLWDVREVGEMMFHGHNAAALCAGEGCSGESQKEN